jgi:hypothetical protein
MSFPSMSIQRLVELSSIVVNPIVTQHFCRRESHEASTGRAFPNLLTRPPPFRTSTKFDGFLPAQNDGVYPIVLEGVCDLY